MTKVISLPALAAGLLLTSCGGGDGAPPTAAAAAQVSSPVEVRLAVGDEVRVDGLLRVGFAGVRADSRCPTSVVCPWEGDGAVEIHYAMGMGPSYPDTLHTTLEPRSVAFNDYRIILLELDPYPDDTDPIPLDAYTVRLRVERLDPNVP